MNIFYLHENPKICAKYHNDSHCVKMILEYAQLMCTAHRELDVISKGSLMDTTLYKATHKNHPSAVWVRESKANYEFLHKLFSALCNEYTHRYGKIHKTEQKLRKLLYCRLDISPKASLHNPHKRCLMMLSTKIV